MKALAASTPKGVFDLESQSVLERPIDAVELTDEDLEQVTGSWGCWECGWGGFGFSPFWGSFGFSSFWGSFGFSSFWGGFGNFFGTNVN